MPLTTDETLAGLGLVLVLAVGAQLLAGRLRVPAIVLLLPVGVIAGVATDDVHPDALLGHVYQPFVSVAVGVILFEAGLRLSFAEVRRQIRRTVARLVAVGGFVTWVGVTLAARLLFPDLSSHIPVLLGAILVVSGPTVTLPLLAFVRPAREVRALLTWEGVLVDPFGAVLGVLVFHAVLSGAAGGPLWRPGQMLASVAVGALVGAAGAAILWLLLREAQRTEPRHAVPVVVMTVVAALVGADLLRDDAGFVATTLMGMVLANQRQIDISPALEFQGALVRLLVGVLFVLIAASVSPSDIGGVLPGALVLVAVMALLIRPLAVALATWRAGLTLRERAFAAWMAPRGIVAGATASAFSLALADEGLAGAERVLPIVFVAILGTVVLYGLTAAPVARLLGVAGAGGRLVLVVGGNRCARAVAEALARAGVAVRMWVGRPEEQAAAREAGIDVDRGAMLADAVAREAELEDVTDAVLMTPSDDFNALVAAELRAELGHDHVFRPAPDPEQPGLLLPPDGEGTLPGLTFAELDRRLAAGAEVVAELADRDTRRPRLSVTTSAPITN